MEGTISIQKILMILIYLLIGSFIIKDIFEIFYIKKKEKINILFIISMLVLIITIFHSTKYSARILNYCVLPLSIYKVYKNKKYEKIGLEYGIVLFLIAILVSGVGISDLRGIRDSFLDISTFMIIPLYFSQFKINNSEKRVFIEVGILGFMSKLIISFLEKWGYIRGLYGGDRISGYDHVWRFAPIIMLGIIVIGCLLMYRENKKIEVLGLSVLLVLSLISMIWTQNRANWVALILCLGITLVFKYKKKGIIMIGIIFILLFSVTHLLSNNKYVKRLESITNIKKGGGNSGRIELWKNSIRIFKTSPIKGVGFTEKSFKKFEIPENYKYVSKIRHGHSHSSYFYLLATMGIIGFFSYGFLIILMLYLSYKKRKEDYNISFFLILSIQIFALFETPVKYNDLTGIMLISIGILLTNRGEKSAKFNFFNK
ncbi:MAG: O-antigen ligase family protein [Fusobacteriaceae bacterium]